MKANELRVGNLVHYHNGKYLNVIPVITDIIDLIETTDKWQPIPITQEWLLKFGFKIDEPSGGYHLYNTKENNDIWLFLFDDGLYIENSEWTDITLHPLKYVHQLQNLFFALTEEELNYKE